MSFVVLAMPSFVVAVVEIAVGIVVVVVDSLGTRLTVAEHIDGTLHELSWTTFEIQPPVHRKSYWKFEHVAGFAAWIVFDGHLSLTGPFALRSVHPRFHVSYWQTYQC